MSYVIKSNHALEDGLLAGGEFPVRLDNISLTGGATVERGDLLVGDCGVYSLASGEGDLSKSFAIAARDYVADSLGGVTQAYSAGLFAREKINLGGAASSVLFLDNYEQALRVQNIHLTSRKG